MNNKFPDGKARWWKWESDGEILHCGVVNWFMKLMFCMRATAKSIFLAFSASI
jgi:hypothetical protein